MGKNVKIPLELLNRTIELLQCWDVSEYVPPIRDDYDDVLWALMAKKQSIELRDAYSKIIYADSEDERHEARMEYLQQKRMNAQLKEPPF